MESPSKKTSRKNFFFPRVSVPTAFFLSWFSMSFKSSIGTRDECSLLRKNSSVPRGRKYPQCKTSQVPGWNPIRTYELQHSAPIFLQRIVHSREVAKTGFELSRRQDKYCPSGRNAGQMD